MNEVWKQIEVGDLTHAEFLCLQRLDQDPHLADAKYALALISFKRGETQTARLQIHESLRENPKMLPALLLGAKIALESNDFVQALEWAHRALAVNPGEPRALQLIGQSWRSLRQPYRALQAYDALIQLNAQNPEGYFGMADVFKEVGATFDAAEALAAGVKHAPSVSRLTELADLELSLGRPAQAFDAALRATQIDPSNFSANLIAGRSLTELGEFDQAEGFWRKAKTHSTLAWRVEGQKGYALTIVGKFKEAERCLNTSLSLNPLQGSAYELILAGQKVTEADRGLIRRMENLTQDGQLGDEELAPLFFALGKAYDDLGDPSQAMSFFDEANAIRRRERGSQRPFRPEADAIRWETQRALFPDGFPTPAGPANAQPIFVVGIMRSGTTLLEQTLASHPQVVGAGELDFWQGSETLMIDPETKTLRDGSLSERRTAFRRLIASFGGADLRVVDKYHANLCRLGLIHQAFPDSPIIHVRRDPLDTAISIWMTDSSASYIWDRNHIITAILQAREQANYWKERLPQNRFLDIRYEDLVADPGKWTRTVLRFCGLPWDDGCLNPNRSQKNVRTVSTWQVRQPIYKTSVARWKKYEPWLGEFTQLLPLSLHHHKFDAADI